MKIVILGGGVVGVTTAYYLVRGGHEVTVVDRQAEVARECSHANGGMVAISQAVPWSAPGVPIKLHGRGRREGHRCGARGQGRLGGHGAGRAGSDPEPDRRSDRRQPDRARPGRDPR